MSETTNVSCHILGQVQFSYHANSHKTQEQCIQTFLTKMIEMTKNKIDCPTCIVCFTSLVKRKSPNRPLCYMYRSYIENTYKNNMVSNSVDLNGYTEKQELYLH